ncbi:BTAD domain-containing putative transcriptional regulator, partial [Actinoplanes sp. NPDC024001]|uniref:AfsR/SARP family transcriptional regulator n=1 Tax=Actinoplanes sp. NPDC024001 TaxID=3154598 RepID=UPI0033F75A88
MLLVRVLGPFEVEGGDGPVTLAGASQRAVLALLALRAGRPVGVPDLIDALWPEDPPPSARNSLQSHVARLRARLGVPGLISLEPAGYRLNVPRSRVDALRFEDLVRDRTAPAEAVSLWRGPPLPEFPGEPFRSAAVRLVSLHRSVLLHLAGTLPTGSAAAELHAAFDSDPCWEEGALALAEALSRAGSRGDAMEVLRRHADAVVDHLGLDPSDQIRQAQLTLLRGAPSRPRPAADPPPATAGPALPPSVAAGSALPPSATAGSV